MSHAVEKMAAMSAMSAAASASLGMRLGLGPVVKKPITAVASSGTTASNGKKWIGKVVPFEAHFDFGDISNGPRLTKKIH